MKKHLIVILAFVLLLGALVGCGDLRVADDLENTGTPTYAPSETFHSAAPSEPPTQTPEIPGEHQEEIMQIKVTDGTNEITFQLNDSSAAQSLYAQLPLTVDVENYGSNEKIFYPPEKLDTSDVEEGSGPAGTLAYFSPWGDVVMYYSSFGSYPGLYVLGEAAEGADNIQNLSGMITITAK